MQNSGMGILTQWIRSEARSVYAYQALNKADAGDLGFI